MGTATIEETEWLTTADLAERFGTTPKTVRSWLGRGIDTPAGRVHLRYRHIGGRLKFKSEWVNEFMAALNADLPPVAESPAKLDAQAKRDQAKATKALVGKRRL